MALATVSDLRALLKEDATGLSEDEGTLLLDLATASVQAAARQTLTEIVDDTVTLMGTRDRWFDLPQQPVTAVTAVSVDGEALAAGTDYKRFGSRLWRRHGWARCDEPSEVTVTYSHGYPDWDPRLGLARGAVLALAAQVFTNPIGAVGMSIDDYRLQFTQTPQPQLAGLIPESVSRALRRTYGPRARMTRVG